MAPIMQHLVNERHLGSLGRVGKVLSGFFTDFLLKITFCMVIFFYKKTPKTPIVIFGVRS